MFKTAHALGAVYVTTIYACIPQVFKDFKTFQNSPLNFKSVQCPTKSQCLLVIYKDRLLKTLHFFGRVITINIWVVTGLPLVRWTFKTVLYIQRLCKGPLRVFTLTAQTKES